MSLKTIAAKFITDWTGGMKQTPGEAVAHMKRLVVRFLEKSSLSPDEAKSLFDEFRSSEMRKRMIEDLKVQFPDIREKATQDFFLKQIVEPALKGVTKAEPKKEKKEKKDKIAE